MLRLLVNVVGLLLLGLLALAAYEAGGPVEVWRRPAWIHAERRPRTRAEVKQPLEVQLEIHRHYRRPGFLIPHLAPLEARPDIQVVVVDLEDGDLTYQRMLVDTEAGAPWDPGRKPAEHTCPTPPGAAELLAAGTGTWPLGDGLAVRVSEVKETYRIELTREGADPVLLHEVDITRGEVPADVLREQLKKEVLRR
jgi:hypothetical protein